MGCAPSIHVSQSGIVYCREEIRESSSRARASSLSEVVSHIHSSEPGTLTSTVRITRGRFLGSDKRRSVETESQSFDLRTMEETSQVRTSISEYVRVLCGSSTGRVDWPVLHIDCGSLTAITFPSIQEGRKEFTFGPMKLFQNPMSVRALVLFEDKANLT